MFAIEGFSRSGVDLSIVETSAFYGVAVAIGPTLQAFGLADARPSTTFACVVAVVFVVLAFVETAFLIVFRRAAPQLRWLVRAVAGILAIAALLFTPQATPMRLF